VSPGTVSPLGQAGSGTAAPTVPARGGFRLLPGLLCRLQDV